MIQISNIKVRCLELSGDEKDFLKARIASRLRLAPSGLGNFRIVKRSLDARKKPDLFYLYTVQTEPADRQAFAKRRQQLAKTGWKTETVQEEHYEFPSAGDERLAHRPVIVGAGPAGYFCALMLARHGYRPLLIERGKCVSDRTRDVNAFWEGGPLDPDSNVQFGEGGAGTFSDGKLNTMTKDKYHRGSKVFEIFVEHGAPEDIFYVNRPHVGTDILASVVEGIRNEIISLGGEVRFSTKLIGIRQEQGKICSVTVKKTAGEDTTEEIPCEVLVLALGHSARDTFAMLHEAHVRMEPKAFAVGVRIQHPQEMIDKSQYGMNDPKLPAADYKLTYQTSGARGVYSFCMCPGGKVVNASSENGRCAVNGMSYRARDGINANSALIITVTPEDFGAIDRDDPLSGLEFQRRLEAAAFREGKGRIPVQLYGDYREDRVSTGFGEVKPDFCGGYSFGNLRQVLPKGLNEALLEAMPEFGKKIRGFDRPDALLAGVESRTSSPLRMNRDEQMEANIGGIYPCGEGAGYAGGITSAAMDGLRIAETIAARYAKPERN